MIHWVIYAFTATMTSRSGAEAPSHIFPSGFFRSASYDRTIPRASRLRRFRAAAIFIAGSGVGAGFPRPVGQEGRGDRAFTVGSSAEERW